MAVFSGNGSAGSPSFTFSSDTDTGLYRIGDNDIGLAVGSALRLRANSNGVAIGSVSAPSASYSVVTDGSVLVGNPGIAGHFVRITAAGAAQDSGVQFGDANRAIYTNTTNSDIFIKANSGGPQFTIFTADGRGKFNKTTSNSSELFDFEQGGSTKVRITNGGQLCAGATLPQNANLNVAVSRRLSGGPTTHGGYFEVAGTKPSGLTSGVTVDLATISLDASVQDVAYFKLTVIGSHQGANGGYSAAYSVREGVISGYSSVARIHYQAETTNQGGSVNAAIINVALTTNLITATNGSIVTFTAQATVTITGSAAAGESPDLAYRLELLNPRSNSNTYVSNLL